MGRHRPPALPCAALRSRDSSVLRPIIVNIMHHCCYNPSRRVSQSGSSGRPAVIHRCFTSFNVLSPVLQTRANFSRRQCFQKNSVQSQARRLVHNSAYCWETQLFSSLNCWRQAHAIEIERVLQHSAYALACCWHFCMAACFIRNMKAAKLISRSKKSRAMSSRAPCANFHAHTIGTSQRVEGMRAVQR